MLQTALFEDSEHRAVAPFKTQLLKWIGNKQRFAHEIVALFPEKFGTYFEPFVGSGAVIGTLAPRRAVASDALLPLIEIWKTLVKDPETVKEWYRERWEIANGADKVPGYERIKRAFNARPNGADLLFLSRACYGGVIRFRQNDGHMSTPCGVHNPISPESFSQRADIWHERIAGLEFTHGDYKEAFARAKKGDLIYCDPPYVHSQSILYRGQSFSFEELVEQIERAKWRGVNVALSIDGTKKSGAVDCALPIPPGLFTREIFVNLGRSMLRRFQMGGQSLESELVSDRLLLTY